jgi:hypothetical protein
MSGRSTLSLVSEHLLGVFSPLRAAIIDPLRFRSLFQRLGWSVDGVPPGYAPLADLVVRAADLAAGLADDVGPADVKALFDQVSSLFDALLGLPPPPGVTDTARALGEALVELLVVEHLARSAPQLLRLLISLGIVTSEYHEATDARPSFVRRELHWTDLPEILGSPRTVSERVYGWGVPDFDFSALAADLWELLTAFGVSATLSGVGERADREAYADNRGQTAEVPNVAVEAFFMDDLLVDGPVAFGVRVSPLPAEGSRKSGLVVEPIVPSTAHSTIEISDTLRLVIGGATNFGSQFGLVVRPGEAPVLRHPFASGAGALDGAATIALESDFVPPFVLLGRPAGSRLELRSLRSAVEFRAPAGAAAEVRMELTFSDVRLVIAAREGDGFVSQVVGDKNDRELQLIFGLRWSSSTGLGFAGAGLRLNLPVNATLGPVRASQIELGILGNRRSSGAGELALEVSAALSVSLGPLAIALDGLGVHLEIGFEPGNAGPFSIDAGLKPPVGVGISINAGPVNGGGFIRSGDGRYFGVLELKIYGVSVKAFGVIDTKLPDGSKGFSFVIVISAEFTAIQLGLGFTLLGVGGLLGINRRLDGDALRNAVREGHLENILFPRNLTARAPEVIRDLTAIFPATEGRYVFGPMAKIGWGTPTLIRADLGIILELPGPILSILGEVHCLLPREEAAVVKLHLSVEGQLDFARKSFELFASLHDSVIEGFPVNGQMAMRLRWGAEPVFALAVGGFHPGFTPPAGFPALKPLRVDLGRNGNPGIFLTGYFAITSNTAQVGGKLALRASGSGVTLSASLGINAIFVFSPFSFEAEIDADVRVSFHGRGIGVHLHGTLSGPSPWHVRGEVCVSILWWDACLGFDKTFGGGQPVELPAIDPFTGPEATAAGQEKIPALRDALIDPRSWEPVTPAGVFQVVSLAQGAGETPHFDPMGALSMRQRAVPLETSNPITRFGSAKALNPRAFKLSSATVGSSPLIKNDTIPDNFAPAQFFEMSAAEKLSASSFQPATAGYVFGDDTNNVFPGSVGDLEIQYETTVEDSRAPAPPAAGLYPLPAQHLIAMLAKSAAGTLGLGQLGDLRYTDPRRPDRFRFRTPKFLAAEKGTLAVRDDLFGATSKVEALFNLRDIAPGDPVTFASLQVVPEHEVLAALP